MDSTIILLFMHRHKKKEDDRTSKKPKTVQNTDMSSFCSFSQ